MRLAAAYSSEEPVPVADIVIHAAHPDVVGGGILAGLEIVIEQRRAFPRTIRSGPVFSHIHGDGILACFWHAVPGKRVAKVVPRPGWISAGSQRIVYQCERAVPVKSLAEVAAALFGSGDSVEELDGATLPDAFIIGEKERTILGDGPAESGAKLVALVLPSKHLVAIVLPAVGI